MSGVTRVKICGVTSFEDALMAARAGADLLGLNFYPPSPRCLDADQARSICRQLRDSAGERCPVLAGVFVNEEPQRIAEICARAGLDCAQLSGDETPEMLEAVRELGLHAFKAIRPRSVDAAREEGRRHVVPGNAKGNLPSLLLDAWHPTLYGGSGEQAGDELAQVLVGDVPRLMLAGGLNAQNVGARVRALRPWGVDVASGVERAPGVKDAGMVRAFIAAVRGAA